MESWNKKDQSVVPTPAQCAAYAGSPLWGALCRYLEGAYDTGPVMEYSRCDPGGWNVKYRKAGRGLCTLYPMGGTFIALVVIGPREQAGAELVLPLCTPEVQRLYRETREGMGQRWLMIEVTAPEVLEDVKRLIALRRKPKEFRM